MNTAASRFRRLLILLPRFAERPEQSLAALSAELGVAAEVILADLRALVDRHGELPGHEDPVAVLIEGDTVSVRTDHFLRPMRVTVAELCALELGLGVLAREAGPERAAELLALRARLDACITRLPDDAAYAGLRGGALVHPDGAGPLDALRRALRQSRVVTISYHGPHDEDEEERTVRPYGLCFASGAWYLAAWCERADGMRLFRSDRIWTVTVTARQHEVPTDFCMDDLMIDGRPWVSATAPPTLVVRYSAAIARWIAERDGLPLEPDGSAVRTMPLADREWAIRHVLQYGPDARVIEPEDLAAEVVERLREM
ncbi:MAG: WYL domain-containing protein [Gemmatimonadales bacterium]